MSYGPLRDKYTPRIHLLNGPILKRQNIEHNESDFRFTRLTRIRRFPGSTSERDSQFTKTETKQTQIQRTSHNFDGHHTDYLMDTYAFFIKLLNKGTECSVSTRIRGRNFENCKAYLRVCPDKLFRQNTTLAIDINNETLYEHMLFDILDISSVERINDVTFVIAFRNVHTLIKVEMPSEVKRSNWMMGIALIHKFLSI